MAVKLRITSLVHCRSGLLLACVVMLAGVSGARAQDTQPAPFPNKAAAVLVQGSTEVRFKNDVTNLQGVLTNNAYRWKYTSLGGGSVQTLYTGGAGASKTSFANVGTAIHNASTSMWTTSVANQNFVYYQSGHGTEIDSKNSKADFNGTYYSASQFAALIRDQLPSGHQQYSLNGATQTTCVRTMVFMMEPCHSGGFIYHLTNNTTGDLADPSIRKKYFPFLSDITVITAANANECSRANAGDTGNAFSQALYGFTSESGAHITGALETAGPVSDWAVYQRAAQNDDTNPPRSTPPYSIGNNNGAAFGTGNNATMYVPGTIYANAGSEHPLYRHVSFYPAITYGNNINLRAGNDAIDMRLHAPQQPISGPQPLVLNLQGVAGTGFLFTDRSIKVQDTNPNIHFVDYYTFNDNFGRNSFTRGTITVYFNQTQNGEPTVIPAALTPKLKLYEEHGIGTGWFDTGATLSVANDTLAANITGPQLGEFAIGYSTATPEPATWILLGLGGLLCLLWKYRRLRRPASLGVS